MRKNPCSLRAFISSGKESDWRSNYNKMEQVSEGRKDWVLLEPRAEYHNIIMEEGNVLFPGESEV